MALIVLVSTRGLRNQDTPNEVTIFAASSLADVIQEILRDAPEDIIVRTSFASTSNLVRQIEAGADADIFISANALWMKELRDLGYGVGAVDVFAHNRLVVLAPDNTPLKPAPVVTLFQDPRVQRIALGDPASVPLGKYSRYALVSLDLWSELEVRTVIYGHSATTVLQWVDRGEVDLAVTYASDIHRANHATVLATIPANHHLAITYWQLRLTNTPAAREIEQLLTSPRAKALLSERGFHS
ncbi:MAG: molybdate ABC transporter substrate-binding protein [Alphaproteobacteria bacterium]|nr:MAG: molybdate ABC transporter substrate-binding protein [Alphaproteobacteria bacterium]